jgi:hypothetical protein
MAPSGPLVESRQQTLAAITDALTGQITPALLSTETVTLDPITGAKTYTIVTQQVRTSDGRLTKPDTTTICRSCNAIISDTASKPCTTCTVTLCAGCAGTPPFCRSCRWNDRVRRFWTWLTRLS